jgi:hypothetical protein
LIVAGVPTVNAGATEPPPATVTSWVAHHATPLATVDPKAALDDLAPLGRSVGEARIAGLGESAHGVAEELGLKLRVLRFLAVSVHRVHLRPRRTATRARANGRRAAAPATMVRATARLGRI